MRKKTNGLRSLRQAAVAFAVGLAAGPLQPALADVTTTAPGLDHKARVAVQRLIVSEAVRLDVVPASLALAVADVESGFAPRTLGAAGAVGLLQLQPAMAEREFGAAAETLWDPAINVRIGLRWLARLADRYGGDWTLALSHFRGGALVQEGGNHRAHGYTRAYVERVMRCWQRYRRDPLVRAWIREARGGSRFVADAAHSRFGDSTAGNASPVRRCEASGPRSPQGVSRSTAWCGGAFPPCSWHARRLANGHGRHLFATTPSTGFRRDGRWVAVTGDRRFR